MITKQRIKRASLTVLVVTVLFFLIFHFLALRLHQQGFWNTDRSVIVREVTVCSGIDPNQNTLISPGIIESSQTGFICGWLEVASPVQLDFIWYADDRAYAFYRSGSNYISTGYFTAPIYLKEKIGDGLYHVEIYHHRNIVGAISFLVENSVIKVMD
jgi:hypothetical protein